MKKGLHVCHKILRFAPMGLPLQDTCKRAAETLLKAKVLSLLDLFVADINALCIS